MPSSKPPPGLPCAGGVSLPAGSSQQLTPCEHERLYPRAVPPGPSPVGNGHVPQCDEQGNYRPLQCHGSTGYCWCVDGAGQEIAGTRTAPGSTPPRCGNPGGYHGAVLPTASQPHHWSTQQGAAAPAKSLHVGRRVTVTIPVAEPSERPPTMCERWRQSLLEHYGGSPRGDQYVPQCDAHGHFTPLQCHGDSGYCWCVDESGREIQGTRSEPGSPPPCKSSGTPHPECHLPRCARSHLSPRPLHGVPRSPQRRTAHRPALAASRRVPAGRRDLPAVRPGPADRLPATQRHAAAEGGSQDPALPACKVSQGMGLERGCGAAGRGHGVGWWPSSRTLQEFAFFLPPTPGGMCPFQPGQPDGEKLLCTLGSNTQLAKSPPFPHADGDPQAGLAGAEISPRVQGFQPQLDVGVRLQQLLGALLQGSVGGSQ